MDEGDAVTREPSVLGAHAGDDAGPGPRVPGYELGRLLARGGTSEVWAAVAREGGREVVVKVVHADLGAVEAAAREAAVSARVASAHVVAVEACVALADGRVAVVMPHLRGGALDALVRARGHLSPGEVVTVLAPVASALGRLHDLGVVHGDVSPGNVLLELDGRPVLGDLGLGHVVGEVSPGVWGTDGYVAPEVLLGGDPAPASDVYALGALGWLCLTGTVPGPPGLRPELAEVSRAGEGSEPVVAALAAAVSADPADRPGAHELAWQLFGAAEPEPLRLVRGDDEVSAVTYRLRAAAGRPPVVPASARWWQGNHPTRGGTRVGRHAGDVVRRGWGAAERHRGRRVVVAAAALVPLLVALLVVSVAVLGGAGGPEQAQPAVVPGPLAQPQPARDADPRTDEQAPRSRPAELLDVLADARAAAWREATPALLGEADAPRSAAAVRDAAAVAEVARAGLRYTGLRYTVAEAVTVSATSDRAVLRARIDSGAYTVSGPAGSTSRPPAPGAPVLVDLVRTDVGWRVSDLRPVP
ncbi:MAG TPA: protein kinase [Ornithinibacter sp.]|nr:protein kinase [Ornithinibacter sp.]